MKTAIFVPSYCLIIDGMRLSAMSSAVTCMAAGVCLEDRDIALVILSSTYETHEKEADLKKQLFLQFFDDCEEHLPAIEIIGPISHTFDEVSRVRDILAQHGIECLIVIAEKWDARRKLATFRCGLPGISVECHSVQAWCYERTLEPWLKSIRAAHLPLWILWNYGLLLLTPLLMRWYRRAS